MGILYKIFPIKKENILLKVSRNNISCFLAMKLLKNIFKLVIWAQIKYFLLQLMNDDLDLTFI